MPILGLTIGIIAAVFLIAYVDDPEGNVLEKVIYWTTRGKRLTRTTLNENGDVDTAPDELVSQASAVAGRSVSHDEYALARMLASEESGASPETKTAISWVAVNEARSRGRSVFHLLVTDKGPGDGLFGEQRGRYASTRTDPYESDLQIATYVLDGVTPDPTGGAIHFYRPALQDKLFKLGKTSKDAAQIDREWGPGGFTPPGVDTGIVFYT